MGMDPLTSAILLGGEMIMSSNQPSTSTQINPQTSGYPSWARQFAPNLVNVLGNAITSRANMYSQTPNLLSGGVPTNFINPNRFPAKNSGDPASGLKPPGPSNQKALPAPGKTGDSGIGGKIMLSMVQGQPAKMTINYPF